ncbi:MAG: tRNA (adenosine(37)-N6)-threonylcarbamoyltransferase complex ATPase subunit type 1 TsaE [Planctomycetota bacterium]
MRAGHRDPRQALGHAAEAGLVVALGGELGAGKTTLVRGLARGLGSADTVSSPTYTLLHAYSGRLELRHFDAWMSAREGAFLAGGGAEDLHSNAVCAVEWASEVGEFLPEDRLDVDLVPTGVLGRRIALRARGPLSGRVLARLAAELAGRIEPAANGAVGAEE